MTIAISIKINDGLILAADSASTFLGMTPEGQLQVLNVYNNASKVFNLRKGLPIGAVTWGAGSIGQASISTIIKDLRQHFTSGTDPHADWVLNPRDYTVEGVAQRLRQFVYEEHYIPAFRDYPHQKPELGFVVAGYSANAAMADEFQVQIKDGECSEPSRLRAKDEIGLTWGGDPEALNRLIVGTANGLATILQNLFKIPADKVPQVMQVIQQQLQVPLVLPAMPLQDAIDLAEFLAELTVKFSRFRPGAPTVGGPIELAAISKHEGFRWVKRKYYFDRHFNPEEEFLRVYKPENKEIEP